MEDKSRISLNLLGKQAEVIHSTLIAIAAALNSGCDKYEPMELVPALQRLVDETYELAVDIQALADGAAA